MIYDKSPVLKTQSIVGAPQNGVPAVICLEILSAPYSEMYFSVTIPPILCTTKTTSL